MSKNEKESKVDFQKLAEIHKLPLMILAWFMPLYLVKDVVTGSLLGAGTVLVFLILEGSRFWFENYFGCGWQRAAYGIMLVALSGIAGILLHLMRMKGMDAPLPCFILGQAASIYLVKMLVKEEKNRKAEGETLEEKETRETKEEKGAEAAKEEEEKGVEAAKEEEEPIELQEIKERRRISRGEMIRKSLLSCFAVAAEYTIFLAMLGFLREYAGRWVVSARLFSGGLLITAGLLLLWKLTKTMPKRFEKLPKMLISVGLIAMVLAGFAGLV